MRNQIVIIGTCLYALFGWGQPKRATYQPVFNVGFQQGTHSMFQLGMEHNVLDEQRDWLFLGAGVLTTPYYKKWHWLPYVDLTRSNGMVFYGGRISTRHIQPQVGVSMFNGLDVGMGYAIPFDGDRSIPVIKGFNVSVKFRFSENSKTYLKLM